ncbi:Apospory-associated protein [Corchorus olitorius]|uniref:Apospory-associated protein n=1 Tax=Corchorus olitorius TaxID=93759 RepID=A0A1R3KN01_9ROSI|nr:Apospory-associated protein [Corchorus olitorius]
MATSDGKGNTTIQCNSNNSTEEKVKHRRNKAMAFDSGVHQSEKGGVGGADIMGVEI